MNDVKCECGHVNPHGTVFCEACGKIHEDEEQEKKILDMRYEGSARRSQTYNKTVVDKIWNFFSSVKVGVWLIVVTLIASAIGTIFPQQMYIPPTIPPEDYYQSQYGWLGKMYYQLGFDNLYSSWWYLVLIALIGVSLVICSIDRVVPLYKALKAQRVTRHEGFLERQRVFGISNSENFNASISKARELLITRRYHVREENGDLLAEKGRFSRWGPYVNHIGLIIFLIGGMLRFVPGMYVDKVLWVREGETKVVPDTNGEYYLKNNKFILQVYDKNKDKAYQAALQSVGGTVPKNYQSNVTLYQKDGKSITGEKPKLKKVEDYAIRVNQPLSFHHYSLYQVDYKLDELDSMTFSLTNKKTGKSYGNLTVNLYDPKSKYDLGNGYYVKVLSYFPDFEFSNGQPTTKTRVPNNPAFVFKMYAPDKSKGETSFVAIRENIEPFGNNEYKMAFKAIGTKNVSGLTVRKDLTLWVIILGGILFMLGVIQGAYWNHRRIWIQRKNGKVWIAAHTNKNWYGLKMEIEMILDGTNLDMPTDQAQIEKA
ncbi:MAG: cytochrome c biogenesis protein ResB [Bacillota bacterium]|nr:cytochrome c biogenesis protein ResB [Bacillota bacterium]